MPLTQQQQEQRILAGQEGFYFTPSESLRIRSLNGYTGPTITVTGRFLPVDSLRPVDFSFPHTPNTDRTLATTDFAVGEGWLQSLTLAVGGATVTLGGLYAGVDVVRGSGASSTVLATLLQGTLAGNVRLAWPGSPIRAPHPGSGRIRVMSGSNPAPGAESSESVPTGARWRLLAWRASLTADATVASRGATLGIDDGATSVLTVDSAVLQTASQSLTYSAGIGLGFSTNASAWRHLPLPHDLILLAGYRIRTFTNNLQPGDDWAAPTLLIEEWIEGS